MKQIYLDYASTTPVEEGVVKKMTDFMSFDGNFGNPASRSHSFGWKADEAVEEARNNLATLIGCDPREIIWTSGATESDNLAIKGSARFYKNKGNHLVTSKIEHKAVLDPFRQLEDEGFEVTYLEPNSSGEITVEQVSQAINEKTILGSSLADALHYKDQNIKTAIATIGVLFDKTDNGEKDKEIINHHGRLEFIGDASPSSNAEFYYLNNTDLPTEFRWIPIRTRYDKTEFVKRFKKIKPPGDKSITTYSELKQLENIKGNRDFVERKDEVYDVFKEVTDKYDIEYPGDLVNDLIEQSSVVIMKLKNYFF